MSNLMEKLAISKAIMDKHNGIKRGQQGEFPQNININTPELEEFQTPNAMYNLPQEFISESKPSTQNNQAPTKDRILSSKLPDEIKRLMIENPITPVNPLMGGGPVLSDELVEKASKLMGTKKPLTEQPKQINNSNSDLKKMMKEVVEEVLRENGLILESENKSNETILLKVGQHIFEGKISKIKKVK